MQLKIVKIQSPIKSETFQTHESQNEPHLNPDSNSHSLNNKDLDLFEEIFEEDVLPQMKGLILVP